MLRALQSIQSPNTVRAAQEMQVKEHPLKLLDLAQDAQLLGAQRCCTCCCSLLLQFSDWIAKQGASASSYGSRGAGLSEGAAGGSGGGGSAAPMTAFAAQVAVPTPAAAAPAPDGAFANSINMQALLDTGGRY